jgi:hypothetical protein
MNYKELEIEWKFPKESTDEEELLDCGSLFLNDFTKIAEYNNCFELIVENKVYKGSDTQFEQILLMFPNHKFEIFDSSEKLIEYYEGYLESSFDNYFIIKYQGSYISKFDLTIIELKGSKEAFELIKEKYNLK